jgi:hypothetical protein
MTHLICAYPDCENDVTEDDYCDDCGCYVCEEHNTNLMGLHADHDVEEHWENSEG